MAASKHTSEILEQRLTMWRSACCSAIKNAVEADDVIELIPNPGIPALWSIRDALPAIFLPAQKERFP